MKLWVGPVLIGIAILVAFWLGKSSGHAAEATANWIANAGAELKAHRAYAARDDSLRGVAQNARNGAQKALRRLDSLQASLDAIHIPPSDTLAVAVARQCTLVIQACRERGDSLESALGTSEARLSLMGTRLSQSDSLLKAGLALKGCRWLFFACPSRTAVAGFAGLGGLVAGLWIGHR
jgi:hypothetical protein